MSKKITFDYWKHLYSRRTGGMVSSEIRDLLSLSARPDIISFAGGLPEVRALNHQKLERYIKRTLRTDAEISLQYGDSTGYYPLRTRLIDVMALEGISADEEDIITTTGGQQALDLLAKVFIDPGDTVITEAPSYTGALNAFNAYEANIIGIPIDEGGILVSEVEKKLKELSGKKTGVKFIYVVPNFSNPSGATISLERRKILLDLAKKYNTIIIEDNPYGMLRYEGKAIPSIKELDSKGDNRNVIYISTLSKLFAPGFRIGWIVAPHLILEKLTLGVQSAVLCNSSFSQRIAYEYFSDPSWKNNIIEFIKIYKKRRDTMLSALEENLSGIATWSKPQGGFFIWLKVPDFLNTKEILADTVRNKVAYVPGTGFYADGRGRDAARLAFCTESTENIEKGIKILAKIVKDKIRLYKSFK
ncbi:MAG: PLP-dependent aminotransferase family protein [Actinobacteria bacterium]|nr:PLP-dependent aminotransferase family protein [Actinomycetota bacterium]